LTTEKKNKKIIKIEINKYIEHVTISKKRRPKYKIDSIGEKVLLNPRTVGKERKWKINGQSLYSGMNHNLRAKVVKEIKKYLYEFIRPIPEIKWKPVCIELEFYYVKGVKNKKGEVVNSWDLGNQEFIWMKCFEDALCGNVDFIQKDPPEGKKKKVSIPMRDKYPAKIEDDSVEFIAQRICTFKPIESTEDRKLIFIIKPI